MKIALILLFSSIANACLKDSTNKIYIGTAISSVALLNDTQYQTIAYQEFNSYTSVGQFRWTSMQPTNCSYNYTLAENLLQFANGSKIRAQTLVWNMALPSWIIKLDGNKNILDQTLTNHIRDLVNYTAGRVYSWNVFNEVLADDGSFKNSFWFRNLGISFIEKAFRTANSVDPNVKLYINEYGVYGQNLKKTEAYYHLVKKLLSSGVPIHGVGFQCHLTAGHFPNTLTETLLKFANLGVDVAITDLDVRIPLPITTTTLEQQARDYARAFSACLSIRRCVGITLRQFTDRYPFYPISSASYGAGSLWDNTFNPKLAYNSSVSALKEF